MSMEIFSSQSLINYLFIIYSFIISILLYNTSKRVAEMKKQKEMMNKGLNPKETMFREYVPVEDDKGLKEFEEEDKEDE